MTSAASTPVPHSRWQLRENVNQLVASHSATLRAISTLRTAAEIHRDRSSAVRRIRPPLRQRIAMRRDWPQVIWFYLVLLAMALFLCWVSARLIAHLVPVPVSAAVLPGLLLAAATGGAVRFATHSVKPHGNAHSAGLLPALSLLAASAGVTAWVTLWVVLTSGTSVWIAVAFALCLTVAVDVALLAASYLGGLAAGDIATPAPTAPVVRRTPRRLRARQRRARSRLDDHTRRWLTATHRYAVMIPSTGYPAAILASLLADDVELLHFDGLDPFDAMILSVLRNYHPAVLAADLSAASAKLMVEISN